VLPIAIASVRRFSANIIISLANQLIVSGTSFISGLIVARFCGASEYGLFSVCMTLLITAGVFQGSLVSVPYTIYHARLSAEEQRLAVGDAIYYFTYCALAGVIFISTYFGIFMIDEIYNSGIGWAIAYFVVIPCALFRELCRGVCIGDLRLAIVFYMDSAMSIAFFIMLYIFYVSQKLSLAAVFLSLCISALVGILVWGNAYRHKVRFRGDFGRKRFIHHWHIGKWILAGNAPLAANFSVNVWLVAVLLGTREAGLYGACSVLVMSIHPAVTAYYNVIFPHASRTFVTEGSAKLFGLAIRCSGLIAVVVGVYCLVLFSWGDWLLTTIFGKEFVGSGEMASMLALGLWLRSVSMPMQVALMVVEKAELNAFASLFALLCNILGTLLLIPGIGAVGAVFSMVISEAVAGCVRLFGLVLVTRPREPIDAYRIAGSTGRGRSVNE
jgi:O-antigen/teichoic acid export membrane protein